MKNIFVNGHYEAIDGEYEFELSACYNTIRSWKTSYMRKNSKYDCEIKLRAFTPGTESDFWKFYLELSVNNKTIHKDRIRHEAYDVLAKDKPSTQHGEVEFITLEIYKSTKQRKQ